jgi:BarA-like signal transduction histidine kinase
MQLVQYDTVLLQHSHAIGIVRHSAAAALTCNWYSTTPLERLACGKAATPLHSIATFEQRTVVLVTVHETSA